MDLDFEGDGVVSVGMFKYLDQAIEDFLEEITGKAVTPAAKHLFEIRENGTLLNQ